jgi:OOP family OmpA-OmpF porin
MKRSFSVLVAVAATLSLLGGCAAPEPNSPNRGLTEPVATPVLPGPGPAPATTHTDVLYSMYITQAVRSVCSGPDPVFTFDSSKPTASDHPTMKNLVTCMKTGPLRDKSVVLTGRTDPRGTAAYNDKLGLERAEKVKRAMVTDGVDAARIKTTSLGSEDASGDPANWPRDRRVQIDLAE